MRKFLLFLFAGFFCFAGTAHASPTAQTERAAETRLQSGIDQLESAAAPAQVSGPRRRKKPRLMTVYRARAESLSLAEYIYLDPEFTWDDYGVRTCQRISRPQVRCYTYVAEDLYDEYGYYFDTELCDWYTHVYYQPNGRLRIKATDIECVYLSEV